MARLVMQTGVAIVLAFMILSAGSAREGTPVVLHESETFVLVELATDVTSIDLGDPGPSVGDLQVWGPDSFLDPVTNEETGATTQRTCIALDETGQCLVSETVVFEDGSTLIIQGVEAAGSNESTRTIVAGSGRFRGASGTVLVQPSEDLSTWTKTFEVWLD